VSDTNSKSGSALTGIDRIQLSAEDGEQVAARWIEILGAEHVQQDRLAGLNAKRRLLSIGNCHVEILQPDGAGAVQDHLASRRGGLFAAGMATADIDLLSRDLTSGDISFHRETDQLFLDEQQLGIAGLRLVISADATNEPTGRLRNLYEVTHLTGDASESADRLAAIFSLESSHFVPISSDAYGYEGSLTLFDPDRLDRIETIHPYDRAKTMGRYFDRFGASLYMCYGECDDLPGLREHLMALLPDDWTGPREGPLDGLFIHPKVLGGVMLGVSRTTFAWSWSGSPERIRQS
jgi:hypothetical protein